MGVLLGGVTLDGLAAAASIDFGGRQALAVHQMPGGTRVIDAMGPDDADIVWRGYLAGNDAVAQARVLDAMRRAGTPVALSWDEAAYTVVIADLSLCYTNTWWISYEIHCRVIADPPTAQVTVAPAVVPLVVADLEAAAAWCPVAAALAAVQSPGAAAMGTQANAAANAALAALRMQIDGGIALAGAAMSSASVPALVAAAGQLAQLTAARGYVGRAEANLANAGP